MTHLFTPVSTVVLATLFFPVPNAGLRNDMSEATNTFSINLMKEVFDKDPGNVVVSPVSLSTLLAIVHQAAASRTRQQLTEVLFAGPKALRDGYSNITLNIKNSHGNTTLEFANGAFLQRGLNVLDSFRRVLADDFQSEIEPVNFFQPRQAAYTINSWISERTHGRILDLIRPDSLLADTKLVLANAIYFKSLWQFPFIEQFTKKGHFLTEDGNDVLVPTMHLDAQLKEGYFDDLFSRWIDIPFEGNKYSMVVVMPSRNVSLREMVKRFTVQHLSTILETLNTDYLFPSDLFLSLPKFKLTTEIDFVPTLMQLGLTDLFTTKSDLLRITGDRLFVNQVVQKAEIEVEEKGATASSGTGLGVVAISAPAQFEVNRPFLFFIIDNVNNIPLFVGKVTNPSP